MSPRRKGTGERWDVRGNDVPGGRMSRSLLKGLSNLDATEKKKEMGRRRKALDRLRAHARNADPDDRQALWNVVGLIGRQGYPTWDEVIEAKTANEYISLALLGAHADLQSAKRDRGADISEQRTCRQGVSRYLTWKEKKEFAVETIATDTSVLSRLLEVEVENSHGHGGTEPVKVGDLKVAELIRSDGEQFLEALEVSRRTGDRIESATFNKHRKILHAWFNWELKKELDRAERQNRQPLFSINVFAEDTSGYSKPVKDSSETVEDIETRRFHRDEMESLLSEAGVRWRNLFRVARRLGLRPGEVIHLRWLDDVRPLSDGRGYEVRLDGGRGRDRRCGCRQCRSERGWAPKNGARRYILDRTFDDFGWVVDVCDALDEWVVLRSPSRGDFLFPDPDDWSRPLTNHKLNESLHEIAGRAGIETGLKARGSRTFHSFRHTCGSELLEQGVTHPHAAYWIGDSLRQFQKTYGKPTDDAMARAIFTRRAGGSG